MLIVGITRNYIIDNDPGFRTRVWCLGLRVGSLGFYVILQMTKKRAVPRNPYIENLVQLCHRLRACFLVGLL